MCVGAYRNNFLPAERALGAASTAPVYVILSDGRGGSPQNSPPQYRIEQLPNGFTTGELADQLSQSASNAGGHLRMLVSCLVCLWHSALRLSLRLHLVQADAFSISSLFGFVAPSRSAMRTPCSPMRQ